MRPQSDDDTSHVVTAGPVSRRVRGQTVVQQLSGAHVECQKGAERLQKTADAEDPDHNICSGVANTTTVFELVPDNRSIFITGKHLRHAVTSLAHLFYDG